MVEWRIHGPRINLQYYNQTRKKNIREIDIGSWNRRGKIAWQKRQGCSLNRGMGKKSSRTAGTASSGELAVALWLGGTVQEIKIIGEHRPGRQSRVFMLVLIYNLTKAVQSCVLLKKQRDMSNTEFPFHFVKLREPSEKGLRLLS